MRIAYIIIVIFIISLIAQYAHAGSTTGSFHVSIIVEKSYDPDTQQGGLNATEGVDYTSNVDYTNNTKTLTF